MSCVQTTNWRLQVQSWLQTSNNTGIINTCTRSWLMESEEVAPRGFNKGRSSKFRVGSRVRQTHEEGRRTYRPKRCGNNNKDEDISPKTLSDKIIKLHLKNSDNLFIHIYQICMICKSVLLIKFLNEPMLILLHTVKWFQVLLCITSNSITHQSFVYTLLKDQTLLFLTILFSISHLFALSLNAKQFYLTHR